MAILEETVTDSLYSLATGSNYVEHTRDTRLVEDEDEDSFPKTKKKRKPGAPLQAQGAKFRTRVARHCGRVAIEASQEKNKPRVR